MMNSLFVLLKQSVGYVHGLECNSHGADVAIG